MSDREDFLASLKALAELAKENGKLKEQNRKLRELMTGWDSSCSGWRNDIYIDSIGDFFETYLNGWAKEDEPGN